jgi:O-antigen/teichoic acid export membrane protein
MGIIARQAVRNTILTYVGIGLGFLNVVLLYPKVLDSAEFGLTRLLLSVCIITAQIAQLGAENTVVRYFPYFRDPARGNRGLLGMLLLFGTLVSLAAMVVLGAMHGLLSEVFSDRNALYGRYGLLVLPLVLSEIFFILLRSYSRSLRRAVQPVFIREFLLRLLQTVLIAVQWAWPMPFGWFMAAYAGIFLLTTLALAWDLYRAGEFVVAWRQRWLPGRLRRSMGVYGLYTLLTGLAGIALGNLDQLMIGALLGDGLKYVAYYAVGFYFGSVIAAPTRALQQVAMPLLADAWKRNDRATIDDLYKRSSLVQTLAGGYLFLMVWACSSELLAWLSPEYAMAGGISVVVAASYFVLGMNGLAPSIIGMSRSYTVETWGSIGLLFVNASAGFFLIRLYGPIGAAWGTFCGTLLITVSRTVHLWRTHGLLPFDRRTLLLVVAVALVGILAQLLPVPGPAWTVLLVKGAAATLAYAIVVYLTGAMAEIRRWVRSVQKPASR